MAPHSRQAVRAGFLFFFGLLHSGGKLESIQQLIQGMGSISLRASSLRAIASAVSFTPRDIGRPHITYTRWRDRGARPLADFPLAAGPGGHLAVLVARLPGAREIAFCLEPVSTA